MITVSMPGAFHDGWFEGTSLGHGEDLDTSGRELLWEIYRNASRRHYGRNGFADLLSFPETAEGLDALDTLFDTACNGVNATNDNPEDRRAQVACRLMADRTLVAIRELEARLSVDPGQLTYLGIRR